MIRVRGIPSIQLSIIRTIKKYEDDNNVVEFLKKLSDIGVGIAQATFDYFKHTNLSDVVVSVEWQNDYTLLIRADGNEVAFMEFGTGRTYSNDQHEWGARLGLTPTSLMKNPNDQYWVFDSQTPGPLSWQVTKSKVTGTKYMTEGNPPARAMYDAWVEMRNSIDEIAKEVFG